MLAVGTVMPAGFFTSFTPLHIVEQFKSFLNQSSTKNSALKEAQKRYEVSHRLATLVCDVISLDNACTVSTDSLSEYLLEVDEAIASIRSIEHFSSRSMQKIFDDTLTDLLNIQFKLSNVLADRLLAGN